MHSVKLSYRLSEPLEPHSPSSTVSVIRRRIIDPDTCAGCLCAPLIPCKRAGVTCWSTWIRSARSSQTSCVLPHLHLEELFRVKRGLWAVTQAVDLMWVDLLSVLEQDVETESRVFSFPNCQMDVWSNWLDSVLSWCWASGTTTDV